MATHFATRNLMYICVEEHIWCFLATLQAIVEQISKQHLAFFTLTARNNPRQVRFDFMPQTLDTNRTDFSFFVFGFGDFEAANVSIVSASRQKDYERETLIYKGWNVSGELHIVAAPQAPVVPHS